MILDYSNQVLFSRDEVNCPCCGEAKFAEGFTADLRDLRLAFGKPMIVNSCCRCPDYNEHVGGHKMSLHKLREGRTQGTCAIDISCPDNVYKCDLVQDALNAGWSVGVYKTFVHLDRRGYAGLPQSMFWGAY